MAVLDPVGPLGISGSRAWAGQRRRNWAATPARVVPLDNRQARPTRAERQGEGQKGDGATQPDNKPHVESPGRQPHPIRSQGSGDGRQPGVKVYDTNVGEPTAAHGGARATSDRLSERRGSRVQVAVGGGCEMAVEIVTGISRYRPLPPGDVGDVRGVEVGAVVSGAGVDVGGWSRLAASVNAWLARSRSPSFR